MGRVHAFLVMFRRLADSQRRAYLAHAACALQTCKRRELVVIEGMYIGYFSWILLSLHSGTVRWYTGVALFCEQLMLFYHSLLSQDSKWQEDVRPGYLAFGT